MLWLFSLGGSMMEELERWHFENNEKAANELLNLVLQGKKTATSSALLAYQSEGLPIPKVGDQSIVTYFDGKDGCIIENIDVRLIPYNQMTYDIVKLEGEDDCLESWKNNHDKFFSEDAELTGYEFSEDMMIVFEIFKVIKVF